MAMCHLLSGATWPASSHRSHHWTSGQQWSSTVNGGGPLVNYRRTTGQPPPDHRSTTAGPPVNGGGQLGHGPGQFNANNIMAAGARDRTMLATGRFATMAIRFLRYIDTRQMVMPCGSAFSEVPTLQRLSTNTDVPATEILLVVLNKQCETVTNMDLRTELIMNQEKERLFDIDWNWRRNN
ncbi:hypothetical protein Tco_1285954 [Tanacetum coccineum]